MHRALRSPFLVASVLVAGACSGGADPLLGGTRATDPVAPDPTGGGASPAASPSDAAVPTGEAGGASDAGAGLPVMAGGDAGGACAGAIVCEDFDEYAVGVPEAGPVWSIVAPDCSGTGVATIDDTESHSGAKSLKVVGAAGYCNHVFLGTSAVAQLAGAVWARFYVRLSTALDADHATFLAMHDANDAGDLRMGGQDSVLMWNRESDDATLPEMSPAGTALSVAPSALDWHCVELGMDPSGPTFETWVDGELVPGLVVGTSSSPVADGEWIRDTSWAPRLTDARFGWESYDSEAETLWFDDIAIGASRIGCDG